MEDFGQLIPWIAVSIVIVGLIAVWMRKPPTTGADALAQVQEATEITRQLVAAAEQLWTTGRLPRDERFDWVTTKLAARYPDMDSEQAAATIEAAVYWLKNGLARAQAK
jgi:ADP-ribosylglycohydrolase